MARRRETVRTTTGEPGGGRITDIDVAQELSGSFLEYAYSVIYSRALPDARDGLKPVHRRILYQMAEMGLRPDRGHVKSARVVGEVMGKLHPHGDGAIYEALVRLAQPFSARLPVIDGHGNFGSPDAPPAAMRYTECRLSPAALLMTDAIGEDTVDFGPNYDGALREPGVLPAAFPNLLVNGGAGIAVGMATNMAPHNLVEVIAAARHLIAHPDATLAELMRLVPGPDLPTGGRIIGLEGVREAYQSGRGSFRTRATTRVENVTARKKGIVVTELPYGVGPERVVEKIGELVRVKRLAGISDVIDLTDGRQGLRLVIEVKNGFVPEAVLEALFRLTPMEESFAINNVALVEGQPRTLGLRELLSVYVEHRLAVVRRRTDFRRRKDEDRLHLVLGLIVAILDIDEVIAVIRASDDSAAARAALREELDLSETQAAYILEMPLRRLTRFSLLELEAERDTLGARIEELTAVLGSDARLRELVSGELAEVAATFGTPRRTVLLESTGAAGAPVQLEVSDDPCRVLLSSTGLVARTTGDAEPAPGGARARHDVVVSAVRSSTRGEVLALTTAGRAVRLPVLDLPALPPVAAAPSLAGGAPLRELLTLGAGEEVLALVPLAALAGPGPGLVLGTAGGVVKRVAAEAPGARDLWELITLRPGDRVVGAAALTAGSEDLVFITSDAQLLRFGAGAVRPQGRAAAGVAGVRLAPGRHAVFFGVLDPAAQAVVVTVAGAPPAPVGGAFSAADAPGTAKVSPLADYPAKGRATGGVRCHRLLRGEDLLTLAWAGPGPARACTATGAPIALPPDTGRRDGSGTPLPGVVAAVAGPPGR